MLLCPSVVRCLGRVAKCQAPYFKANQEICLKACVHLVSRGVGSRVLLHLFACCLTVANAPLPSVNPTRASCSRAAPTAATADISKAGPVVNGTRAVAFAALRPLQHWLIPGQNTCFRAPGPSHASANLKHTKLPCQRSRYPSPDLGIRCKAIDSFRLPKTRP